MFFNYIEKNINKKQKTMKEKRKFSKSIAAFGLLLILILTSFLMEGCTQTNNNRLERDNDREFDNGSGICFSSISEEKTTELATLQGFEQRYSIDMISASLYNNSIKERKGKVFT